MRQIVMTPSVGAPRGRRSSALDGHFGQTCASPLSTKKQALVPPAFQGSPIHLTATAPGITSGATAAVNTLALKEPRATEIHAIKFSVLGGLSTTTSRPVAVNGGMVAVNLTLGSLPLTQGFVPIWSFGRGESLIDDSCALRDYDATDLSFPHCADYVWRLPRPLYVPPGKVITPHIQHRGVCKESIDFRISYVGRTVEEKKRGIIEVPYVVSWMSNSYRCSSARTTERSNETDFRNPFVRPLHVLYFVGRSFQSETHIATGAVVCRGDPYNLYNNCFLMKVSHSSGIKVIEDYTDVGAVFPIDQGAIWPCPHDLPADSYYVFETLFTNVAGVLDPVNFTGHLEQIQLSMVGWREEEL